MRLGSEGAAAMDLLEDSDLALRVADGDRDALAAVYERYADRLYDFCHSMLRDRDEAADAVQQCFLIAAEKMGSLRDPTKMKSWLYAVAKNDCLRRLRRRSKEVIDGEAAEGESTPLSGERTDVESLQELVWSAAKGLAPKDQALLDLHVRQGLNGQELADAVGVKVSNVYVMVNRLKAQFERAMGALLVARLARKDCPDLETILDDSGDEFTSLVRKRVARHIEGCEVCEDNRRRLASPLALLAAVPMVPAPLFLRDRALGTGPSSGHGPPSGPKDGHPTGSPERTPKFSSRTGFPKTGSGIGLVAVPIAAVVVAAIVVGMAVGATTSMMAPRHATSPSHRQAPFTSSSTQPQSKSSTGSHGATTASNGGRREVSTTIPSSSSTTAPNHSTPTVSSSSSSDQKTASAPGPTATTQPGQFQTTPAPTCPLGASRPAAMAATTDGGGYWVADTNGDVTAYGDAPQYPPSSIPSASVTAMTSVPGTSGYLVLASDGTLVAVGAAIPGTTGAVGSACDAIAVVATPDGGGYWIALSSGVVLNGGDARPYGNTPPLSGGVAIDGMATTPDGKGYWLVSSTGGVFAFGDANFHGAITTHLGSPIVAIASTKDGKGYWLFASNGYVFAFNASFYGSGPPSSPLVAVSIDAAGTGYWIVNAMGVVSPFGSATTYPRG